MNEAGLLALTYRDGWRTWGGRLGTSDVLRWTGNRRVVDEFAFQANNRLIPFVSQPKSQEVLEAILDTVDLVGRELTTARLITSATATLRRRVQRP